MPTIADATAQLLAAGAPVLFLDTCSILDVIRAPSSGLNRCVEAGTDLVAMATASPPECMLVVGSFVPSEWADNEQRVLDSLHFHLDGMQKQAAHFHRLCGHLGISLPFGPPQYAGTGLAVQLHDLSRRLLQTAMVLDRHNDTMVRAYDRVTVTKRRPCRKGGELRDCTIFEEYLEVCRQIRSGGSTRKIVFCTSNTDDFCAPSMTPHIDVATDCAAVGLTFTTTLPWAVSELRT